MARIILLLATGFALWYIWRQIVNLKARPPEQRRAATWKLVFIGIFAVTLALVVTGRAHWLTAAVAGLLPVVKGLATTAMRAIPLLQIWQRNSGGQFGPRFKTAYLEVKINLGNGHIDGKVLQGQFAGKELSTLDRPQLDLLADELRGQDREGSLLLSAYMARRFGAGANADGQQHAGQQANQHAGLSTEEALQILGVAPDANPEDISKAHKRLIQKLHPDRGGNDYLAAKVNAAKDLLLSNQ